MGCGDVCLDMDYDGYNEFLHEKVCRARKDHLCCECSNTISPGAEYERVTGKSEGNFWSYPTCVACSEIRKAFVCGSFVFESLWETIEQEMFPRWETHGPYDCLAKLTSQTAINLANEKYKTWREDRDS